MGTGVGFIGISLLVGAWWNLAAWALFGIGVFRVRRYHRIVTDLNTVEGADHEMLEQGLRINRLSPIFFTVIGLVVVGLSFAYRQVNNQSSAELLAARTFHLEHAERLCAFDLATVLLFPRAVSTDLPGSDAPVLVATPLRQTWAFPNVEVDRDTYIDAIGTPEMPGSAEILLCFESEREPSNPPVVCDGLQLEGGVMMVAHSLTGNRSGQARTDTLESCPTEDQNVIRSGSGIWVQLEPDELVALATEAVANME